MMENEDVSVKAFNSVLTLGLSSLDRIEQNLWLGNISAASNLQVIKEKEIHSILTVNSFPLPKKVTQLDCIQIHFIQVNDTPRDDLLSYFEEAYQFIENGLKRGAVLVHCYFGVSRSATIILAYLMKKKNVNLQNAIQYVQSKRPLIGPNPGFLAQLKLYELMHCALDKNNIQYKMFKLYIAIDHIKKENAVPDYCSDIIKPDPILATSISDSRIYKCKKCRRVLAKGFNILPHREGEKYSWRNSKWTYGLERTKICEKAFFTEPLAWMQNVTNVLKGKLYCPNIYCKSKLGSYNWITGCQCPCGTNVSPGFCLNLSKVEKQNMFDILKAPVS